MARPGQREAVAVYFLVKTLLTAVIIAVVSETAKRSPSLGALIASLPLVSVLAVLWLWRDTGDTTRIADHLWATFWYVLPSLPMFLLVPALLRRGVGFWPSLGTGLLLTMTLYLGMVQVLRRVGVTL
jgi:hypothetical protein